MVAVVPPYNAILADTVFTTTIFKFSAPTAAPSATATKNSPIPVGIIVGGAIGGMTIAILTVTLWTWWGRCIKRKQAKQRKEMRDLLTVRENTRRNARAARVPLLDEKFTTPSRNPRRGSRKIKFAVLPSDLDEKEPIRTPSPTPLAVLEQTASLPMVPGPAKLPRGTFLSRVPRTPWGPSVLPSGGPIILPRPKIAPPEPTVSTNIEYPAEDARLSRGSFDSRHLRHMPSAISTESVYSTQSGEERREVPRLREQRSGLLATIRQQLDVNRLSAFSIGSLYSAE